jgi:hypothetical protein
MKKAPKAPVANKPVAKDLTPKNSPKGGATISKTQLIKLQ